MVVVASSSRRGRHKVVGHLWCHEQSSAPGARRAPPRRLVVTRSGVWCVPKRRREEVCLLMWCRHLWARTHARAWSEPNASSAAASCGRASSPPPAASAAAASESSRSASKRAAARDSSVFCDNIGAVTAGTPSSVCANSRARCHHRHHCHHCHHSQCVVAPRRRRGRPSQAAASPTPSATPPPPRSRRRRRRRCAAAAAARAPRRCRA